MLLADRAGDRLEEALHWLQRAAGAGHAAAQNAAAWILATSPRDEVRNGPLAVHLAERSVEQAEDADTLDTLAAALAEEGTSLARSPPSAWRSSASTSTTVAGENCWRAWQATKPVGPGVSSGRPPL